MDREELHNSGTLPFDEASKPAVVAAIAAVLAECGVQRLVIEDPRICQRREVVCRETNLPRELMTAAAGTVFRGEGVAVLVDEGCVRWVARDGLGARLRGLMG